MASEPREDVLSNEDLLGIMFSYIQTYDKPCQELLNLALTCKTFYELALNALWKTLPSLLPLFKVLPSLILVNETYVWVTPYHLNYSNATIDFGRRHQ